MLDKLEKPQTKVLVDIPSYKTAPLKVSVRYTVENVEYEFMYDGKTLSRLHVENSYTAHREKLIELEEECKSLRNKMFGVTSPVGDVR